MGILDFFGGGSSNNAPAQDPSFAALRELGLPQGLLDAYQKEQEQNRKMQAMQMVIGGIGNAVSGYQGMAPVAAPSIGASGGGGGAGGLSGIDGLVDRAMKFSQLRSAIQSQNSVAQIRQAIAADPNLTTTEKQAYSNNPEAYLKLMERGVERRMAPDDIEIKYDSDNRPIAAFNKKTQKGLTAEELSQRNIELATGAPPSKIREGEDTIRKEIESSKEVQAYAAADPMYRSMVQSAQNPSGASDLDLIYGFGKIMDPGSVVREGELVMVQGSGSVQDRLQSLLQSIQGGGKLSPEVRMNLLKTANTRLGELRSAYDNVVGTRSEIAKRRGYGVENIVTRNFGELPQVPDLMNPDRPRADVPYTPFSQAVPQIPGQGFTPDPAAALRELQRRLSQNSGAR